MYKGGLVFQAIPKKCETKVEYLIYSNPSFEIGLKLQNIID